MIIGVDFDNTIASYEGLLHQLAVEKHYIKADFKADKTSIRDSIRLLPDGELKWRQLQAVMYGDRMSDAVPFPEVLDFFRYCKKNDIETKIISHKTQFSNLSNTGADFHKSALQWLDLNGFMDTDKTGLSEKSIFFNNDRAEKLKCIAESGVNIFIDDLIEVFQDEMFPPEPKKILFSAHPTGVLEDDIIVCDSWEKMTGVCFGIK